MELNEIKNYFARLKKPLLRHARGGASAIHPKMLQENCFQTLMLTVNWVLTMNRYCEQCRMQSTTTSDGSCAWTGKQVRIKLLPDSLIILTR